LANINDAFPSNYLKASDLQGRQPVVTIDRVEFEPVGRTREMKPILYFAGKDKGVVLNKTNANKIASLTGSTLTEDWTGMRVTLFATHVEFQGETVEAIRIKAAPQGNGARPQAAAVRPVARPAPGREPAPAVNEDFGPVENITDDEIPF
jgi:hypothetical protein